MDDGDFSIKPDEYEPDLFNDMSVQEEITVGSSENIVNSYSNPTGDHDFGSNATNTIVKVLNPSAIGHQQTDVRNKAKVIYIKTGGGTNLVNNQMKTVKFPNNIKHLKVIPISKFNQESNSRIIQLNQNTSQIGSTSVPRVFNQSIIKNGFQVTKLNNFPIKMPTGQKILIANRPGLQYSKVTPIINIPSSGSFQQTQQQHQTVIQQSQQQQFSTSASNTSIITVSQQQPQTQLQLNHHQTQQLHLQQQQQQTQMIPVHQHQLQFQSSSGQQHGTTILQPISINSQPNQTTALKLEPGDSGFYNLTGGNGPTRYYPRMHSPDKDSLDGSQEMANVYKTNGLRKYARSVCDKVKEKGTTTYSEVADELVHEYAAEHPMIPAQQLHYIQKNIRRRVYDALNVLMALKVLDKEKKEIKWKGLPVNLLEECKQLDEEKMRKTELLQQRVEELSELVLQLISYKNLVGRNRQREKECNAPQANERIKLPFLVITTNNSTIIDCNISPEKLEYLFTFDQPFEMQDEFQTLKQSGFTLRLGTSQCTESQYKRCLELVPNTLRFYVEAIYQQRPAIVPDFVSLHRRNMVAAAQARSSLKSSMNIGSSSNNHHNSYLQHQQQQSSSSSNYHHSSNNNNNQSSSSYWTSNSSGGGVTDSQQQHPMDVMQSPPLGYGSTSKRYSINHQSTNSGVMESLSSIRMPQKRQFQLTNNSNSSNNTVGNTNNNSSNNNNNTTGGSAGTSGGSSSVASTAAANHQSSSLASASSVSHHNQQQQSHHLIHHHTLHSTSSGGGYGESVSGGSKYLSSSNISQQPPHSAELEDEIVEMDEVGDFQAID